MDSIVKYAFETGALNQVILAVIALGGTWFLFMKWWPEHIDRSKRKDDMEREIRIKEIETEKEIKMLEIQGQIDVYKEAVKNMDDMRLSIKGLEATFNEFLQNILSQFIEDRRDLIDTGIFKSKNRRE